MFAEERRADNSRVVAETCYGNFRILVQHSCVDLFFHKLHHRLHKGVALVAHAAADTQNIGLENIDNVGNSRRKILDVLVNNLLTRRIARPHCLKSVPCGGMSVPLGVLRHKGFGVFVDGFLSHIDKSRSGGKYLKTALSAAGTLRTVHLNYHVTYFRTRKISSRKNFAVNNNSRANTRT